MPGNDRRTDAEALLRRFVAEAMETGADVIEFERLPEGLEITLFHGQTGVGGVLKDRELKSALFGLVDERTRKGRALVMDLGGKILSMRCEWYQSFGEACFRLRPAKSKARIAGSKKPV